MHTCRRRFRVVVFGILLLGGVSFARSQRFALHLQGGVAGHEENNLKTGLVSGFGLSIPISERFAVTAELDYWAARSRSSFRKLYNGQLIVAPILLTLQYEFRPNAYFAPYAVVGGGFIYSKFRIGSLITIPEVSIDQTVRSGWAAELGVGARFWISDFWSFFSEIDYLIRTAPAQTIVRDLNSGISKDDIWVNLHVVLLKFGLRISFGR
jgi:opacity protein-like surface antigen